MKQWLWSLVQQVQRMERVNPPDGETPDTPALALQLALKAEGRENDVSERDMIEALEELGVTEDVEVEEALEQFASWL